MRQFVRFRFWIRRRFTPRLWWSTHWRSRFSRESEPNMKYRIVAWAFVGFAVAGCWAFYAFANAPATMMSREPLLTLIEFTCPVVLVSFYFNVGVSVYATLVVNASRMRCSA